MCPQEAANAGARPVGPEGDQGVPEEDPADRLAGALLRSALAFRPPSWATGPDRGGRRGWWRWARALAWAWWTTQDVRLGAWLERWLPPDNMGEE